MNWRQHHSKVIDGQIQLFTIYIKASKLEYKYKKHKESYKPFPDKGDIFFGACSDNHVRDHGCTLCNSLLKLFIGCPVMITENLSVE